MTTLNGHPAAPPSSRQTYDAVVTEIGPCRKREWRERGYRHASFKRTNDPYTQTNLSFLFFDGSALPIDSGFTFIERDILSFNEELNCTTLRSEFYPEDFQMSRIASARSQGTRSHSTPQQPPSVHPTHFFQNPDPVESFDPPARWDVEPRQPSLCSVFGRDIATLYNEIRQATGAPPGECQRMATSAFIALRQAEDKLTPDQVEQLRKGSR
jgi:hypothetical protein